MEEFLVFHLPFARFAPWIVTTIAIIVVILFMLWLRLIRVSQKFMAIIIGGVAMFFYFNADPKGTTLLAAFQALAARQDYYDQRFTTQSVSIGATKLVGVKVRRQTLTLSFQLENDPTITDADALKNYNRAFIHDHLTPICLLRTQENAESFRHKQPLIMPFAIQTIIIDMTKDHIHDQQQIEEQICATMINKT